MSERHSYLVATYFARKTIHKYKRDNKCILSLLHIHNSFFDFYCVRKETLEAVVFNNNQSRAIICNADELLRNTQTNTSVQFNKIARGVDVHNRIFVSEIKEIFLSKVAVMFLTIGRVTSRVFRKFT